MDDENLDPTPNPLISVGHFNDFDADKLADGLEELSNACQSDPENIRTVVRRMVKTYRPAGDM